MDHPEVGFVGFFGRSDCGCTPYDHSYVPYRWSRVLVLPSWDLFLWQIGSFPTDETLYLPLSYKGLNLLLQVVAIGCVVPVVSVKVTILVPWPFVGISF